MITKSALRNINCHNEPELERIFTTVSWIAKPNVDSSISRIAVRLFFIPKNI